MTKKNVKNHEAPVVDAEIIEETIQEMEVESAEEPQGAPAVFSVALHMAADGRWAIENLLDKEQTIDQNQLAAVFNMVNEELQSNKIAEMAMTKFVAKMGAK